ALEPREQLEVLPRREPPVLRRTLRRPADADSFAALDGAAARLERAREQREQRRFAGPVRPDERKRLARLDVEVGRRERGVVAEAALDRPGADQRPAHEPTAAGGSSGGTTLTTVSSSAAGTGSGPGSGAGGSSTSPTSSTGSAAASPQGSSAIRSEKNSQVARPTASSGNATSTPGS